MARKVLQLNSRLSATGFQTGSGQALSFYRSATNPLHVAIFDFHSHTFDSHYNTFCHALSHFATFCNDHRLWQTAALLWRPRLSWPRLEAVNQTGAPYSRPPSRDPWSTGMLCQGFHMFRHYAQTFLIAAFHNLDSMDFVLKGLSMKRDRKHITLTYIPSTYIYIYIYFLTSCYVTLYTSYSIVVHRIYSVAWYYNSRAPVPEVPGRLGRRGLQERPGNFTSLSRPWPLAKLVLWGMNSRLRFAHARFAMRSPFLACTIHWCNAPVRCVMFWCTLVLLWWCCCRHGGVGSLGM